MLLSYIRFYAIIRWLTEIKNNAKLYDMPECNINRGSLLTVIFKTDSQCPSNYHIDDCLQNSIVSHIVPPLHLTELSQPFIGVKTVLVRTVVQVLFNQVFDLLKINYRILSPAKITFNSLSKFKHLTI